VMTGAERRWKGALRPTKPPVVLQNSADTGPVKRFRRQSSAPLSRTRRRPAKGKAHSDRERGGGGWARELALHLGATEEEIDMLQET